MAAEGRHVVVMSCNDTRQATLLREVANGVMQLLLDVRDELTDRQTVLVTAVDVVQAHNIRQPVDLISQLVAGPGRDAGSAKAVVITAEVRTKPEAEPKTAAASPRDGEGGASDPR